MPLIQIGFAIYVVCASYYVADYLCANDARRSLHPVRTRMGQIGTIPIIPAAWLIFLGAPRPEIRAFASLFGAHHERNLDRVFIANACIAILVLLGVFPVFARRSLQPASIVTIRPVSYLIIGASCLLGLSLAYFWVPVQH